MAGGTALRRSVYRLRLSWKLTSLNVRARLEYRVEFALGILAGILWQASVMVFATVLISRFPGLGGWSSGGVLLIASIRLLSHAVYGVLFANVNRLHAIVQEGKLEAFLLRPLPVYRQVVLHQFHINTFGDLAVAVTLFSLALRRLALEWTPFKIVFLCAAVVGGALIEAAVQTALSCAALRSPTATADWTGWLDHTLSTFGNYPLAILPGAVSGLLTFVLPVAFIAYLPAAVLTGTYEGTLVPREIALASPCAGVVLFLAARRLWNWNMRRYEGIGG
ncbi:ABC transporter permease [Streptomyces naphthomycinicus]|uniref:ABC transporter permease n=1 Tax=Streptomyces naphthomycinicus TaxID=2872625 RepID=UPI001CECF030|nr:ABC-2 family transporter protein [Streptomyces sp. TML10]